MGLANVTYNTNPTTFDVQGAKAGSADAMESKLQAVIDDSSNPAAIGDMVLAGVEQGPEWEATLVLGAASGSVTRATAKVFAAVAGNRAEAREKLLQRLVDQNAIDAITLVNKIETAGGGDGSSYMALALVTVP